ncbi:MAG: hypothetical protein AAB455_00010 [Patescibacteria group bacterium]
MARNFLTDTTVRVGIAVIRPVDPELAVRLVPVAVSDVTVGIQNLPDTIHVTNNLLQNYLR